MPDEATKKPEGCICEYEEDGSPRDYLWMYKSACPVAVEEHPWYVKEFSWYINVGAGGGGMIGGPRIQIDEGEVRLRPNDSLDTLYMLMFLVY